MDISLITSVLRQVESDYSDLEHGEYLRVQAPLERDFCLCRDQDGELMIIADLQDENGDFINYRCPMDVFLQHTKEVHCDTGDELTMLKNLKLFKQAIEELIACTEASLSNEPTQSEPETTPTAER